jgi:hypothetical protein
MNKLVKSEFMLWNHHMNHTVLCIYISPQDFGGFPFVFIQRIAHIIKSNVFGTTIDKSTGRQPSVKQTHAIGMESLNKLTFNRR